MVPPRSHQSSGRRARRRRRAGLEAGRHELPPPAPSPHRSWPAPRRRATTSAAGRTASPNEAGPRGARAPWRRRAEVATRRFSADRPCIGEGAGSTVRRLLVAVGTRGRHRRAEGLALVVGQHLGQHPAGGCADRREGVAVVREGDDGDGQGPRPAAPPRRLVGVAGVPERPAGLAGEEVPRRQQADGGITHGDTPEVEHAGQTPVPQQEVARGQVAVDPHGVALVVGHEGVGLPGSEQAVRIELVGHLGDARPHLLVPQPDGDPPLRPAGRAGDRTPGGVDGGQGAVEARQLDGEALGAPPVDGRRVLALDPGQHRPRPGVALARLARRHHLGDLHRQLRPEERQPPLLGGHGLDRPADAGQAHDHPVAQPVHGVVGAPLPRHRQGQVGPLRVLRGEQAPHQRRRHVHLVLVDARRHPADATSARGHGPFVAPPPSRRRTRRPVETSTTDRGDRPSPHAPLEEIAPPDAGAISSNGLPAEIRPVRSRSVARRPDVTAGVRAPSSRFFSRGESARCRRRTARPGCPASVTDGRRPRGSILGLPEHATSPPPGGGWG